MTGIDWLNLETWGNRATCIHLSSDGSDVPDSHSEGVDD